MPRVVIAAGGTAGHVVPALAVADALRSRGAEVEFIGGERAEAELVPAAGYPLHKLKVAGIDRSNPLRAARALGLAVGALGTSVKLLRRLRPDAVMGGGGYVAGPVGLAAAALRKPLVLTEADSHLGISNRLLAPVAKRVFLAFPLEGREEPRFVVSGRPLPTGTNEADRYEARRRFGIGAEETCLLVFGGSIGARTLNEASIEAFGAAAPCAVLHASGRRDYDELSARLSELGGPAHYHLSAYIKPFADALAAADLTVARAGGSVLEVAAAGLPAILVPYPHASADHQTRNAELMAEAGAAVMVPDAELDAARLSREVGELLSSPTKLAAMADAARRASRPDAAERVADELLRLAGMKGRRLHFVGIGGAGMSGLALVARTLGAEVSGSDRSESSYTERLRAAGIEPVIGHDAANLPEGAEVVVSTAIAEDNPELVRAREENRAVLHRADLLAELTHLKRTIAISGTHGKTTTTAMAAHIMLRCGREPAYLVGGELRAARTNAAWGAGEWLVAEADESDRSFLKLGREVTVVTNMELDHHATYRSPRGLREAFEEFAAPAKTRIAWARAGVGSDLTYGVGEGDLRAEDVELLPLGSSFTVEEVPVRLRAPGEHNVLNALAALAACREAGVPVAEGGPALEDFAGTARRFEERGVTASGARIFDDYAHHPTEVRATLEAARTLEPRRLVACFQPHLYSRTRELARDFGQALALADLVVVLDIYPARELAEDYPGVSGLTVARTTADAAQGRPVWWLPTMDDAERMLRERLGEGDVLLTLGAGDVDRLADRLEAPV